MNAITVFKTVLTDGCQLVRPRKNAPGEYDCKHFAEGGNKKGWAYVDHVTANAVITVFNALNETNQAKLAKLPLNKIVTVCWKLIK